MAVLLVSRWDVYTKTGTTYGFFFYIAIAFVIIAFKETVLDFIKKRVLLSVSVIFFVFSLVMLVFAEEMVYISGVSTLGAVMQGFVSCVADVYENHSKVMIDGVMRPNLAKAISHKQAWAEAYGVFVVKTEDKE
jgi:hypothetical protein